MPEAGDIAGRGIQSIVVGGRVLAVMAEAGRPLMLRDIAQGAQVSSAQAHAYLVSFRKFGMVEQSASGRYELGPFALQLGLARMRSVDALRLSREAVPRLAAELGLMVTVTVWGSFGATVVQVQEAVDQVHVNLRAGAVYSVRGTATGRIFAAFLSAPTVEAHLQAERRLGTVGQRIGADPVEDFAAEIAQTRRRFYATAIGSPIPGINAISAPVFDHTGQIQLAITLIGPADAVDTAPDSPHLARLTEFTTNLSRELGYKAADPAAILPEKRRA